MVTDQIWRADLTGFEPATSALTGRRALQAAPQVRNGVSRAARRLGRGLAIEQPFTVAECCGSSHGGIVPGRRYGRVERMGRRRRDFPRSRSLQPEGARGGNPLERGRHTAETLVRGVPIGIGLGQLAPIAGDEVPPHDDLLGEWPTAEKEYP